jgi:hypothetical protein
MRKLVPFLLLGAPPRFGKEKEQTGLEYRRELARRLRDIPAALDGFGRALRAAWEEMRRHA